VKQSAGGLMFPAFLAPIGRRGPTLVRPDQNTPGTTRQVRAA
jgi:hypothetical protein